MKKITTITSLMLTVAFIGFGSLAHAQDQNDQGGRGLGRPEQRNEKELRGNKEGWAKFGTSTPPHRGERGGRFASSTRMLKDRSFGLNASSTRLAGKISNLSSSSFTISAMMRPNGTSSVPTLTVNINASTTIRTGTTTVSVSNLANDKLVMVAGSFDKGTNTITANEINTLPARAIENLA